ncbi:hypothetical protein C0995_014365 [Termitomyces sp. Mi166|nr:hypothetical protein C0995_014365 [Termitomyces sp. Mi166\
MVGEIHGLKAETVGSKESKSPLRGKVENLEKMMKHTQKVYHDMVLGKARLELLEETNIGRKDFETSEALLAAIKVRLPYPPVLTALDMIFLPGVAEDEKNAEDIEVVFLGSGLSEAQQTTWGRGITIMYMILI